MKRNLLIWRKWQPKMFGQGMRKSNLSFAQPSVMRCNDMRVKVLMSRLLALSLFALAICTTSLALADNNPTGLWTLVDDDGKTAKAVVEIVNERGTLRGRVVKSLRKEKTKNPKCRKCSGAKKD